MPADYSQDELKDKRRTFLQEVKPDALRCLEREGRLEAHLGRYADRCRNGAAELIREGMFANRAWQIAIREVILETEAD